MNASPDVESTTAHDVAAKRRKRRVGIVFLTVLVAGTLLYGAFVALVIPNDLEASASQYPIAYLYKPDDDAPLPHSHVISIRAWSERTELPLWAWLHYRHGMDGPFKEVLMERVGANVYVAELPPLPEGERYFFYIQLRDAYSNEATVPAGAPGPPLLHVRFEGHVNPFILGLHITLMIGALFFLIHGLHYSWRIMASTKKTQPRSGLSPKVLRAIRYGWLCFFIGGIPLGIYVSGTALGWSNAWGGWPLGTDITDSKTEVLILYWGVVLALRPDAIWPTSRALVTDRRLAKLVLWGAALTVVVYAIPHSIFFQ